MVCIDAVGEKNEGNQEECYQAQERDMKTETKGKETDEECLNTPCVEIGSIQGVVFVHELSYKTCSFIDKGPQRVIKDTFCV